MDQELNSRWKNEQTPFAGEMVTCEDYIEIRELREALELVIRMLMNKYVKERVYVVFDWHEHDGYITGRDETDWETILRGVESEDSLYVSGCGDDHVRKGFYTESCDFYFRYYLPDVDDDPEFYPGKWGNFDITGSEELIGSVLKLLKDKNVARKVMKRKPKEYYDENWAG